MVTVYLGFVTKLKLLGLRNVVWNLLSLLIDNIFDLILGFGNSYSVVDACCL